jgi:hypothetical protein
MAIRFVEIHAASDPAHLNTEWVVLANDGKLPFNTRGCGMSVARRGQKRRELGIIDPGFLLGPGERVRMLTGSPGAKAQGTPPDDGVDGVKNYYLLLPKPYLQGPGTILTVTLRGLQVSKAEFDPAHLGSVVGSVVEPPRTVITDPAAAAAAAEPAADPPAAE